MSPLPEAPRRLRTFTSALALGALLVGIVAAPASAAVPPTTFDITIGDSCVWGTAKPNAFLRVTVRNSAGALQGKGYSQVFEDGFWQFCEFYGVIRPGFKIRAVLFNETGTLRTTNVTVPSLSLRLDRATDEAAGSGPAHGTVLVTVTDSQFDPWGDGYFASEEVPVDSAGDWSHDFGNDGINVRGGAQGYVEWWNAAETVHVIRGAAAEQIWGWLDTPEFGGYARINEGIDVALRVGATTVGEGHAAADWMTGSYWGLLADMGGELYDLVGGEQLSAPAIGNGVNWTVPTGVDSVNTSTDVVTGQCFANGRYAIQASGPNGFGTKYGTASASGAFSKDMTSQINLRSGVTVSVVCYTGAGDYIGDTFDIS